KESNTGRAPSPSPKFPRTGNRSRFARNFQDCRAATERPGGMSALTTHVLDTMRGRPAAGMKIELWSLDKKTVLKTVQTNSDGRTDAPLLEGDSMIAGNYELVFFVGDYFGERKFLDRVPVRFVISDASAKYHVPLLVSPRSEEHTSELQSRRDLVCRLLLEKKKNKLRSLRIHVQTSDVFE